MLMQFETVYCI